MADPKAPAPAPTPAPAPKPEEKKKEGPGLLEKLFGGKGGLLGGVLEKIGLRGLIYQVGGRKAVAGGGALAVITLIIQTEMGDWPKAVCCAAAAIVSVGFMFANSMEDSKKTEK